jgi:3-deoxy-D-arabino-heptulosonate 7-phosphate (DAHP) synthase
MVGTVVGFRLEPSGNLDAPSEATGTIGFAGKVEVLFATTCTAAESNGLFAVEELNEAKGSTAGLEGGAEIIGEPNAIGTTVGAATLDPAAKEFVDLAAIIGAVAIGARGMEANGSLVAAVVVIGAPLGGS